MALPSERITQLIDLVRRLKSSLDLRTVMPLAIEQLVDVVGADRGMLLLDKGERTLVTEAAYRRGEPVFTKREREMSRTLLARAQESRRSVRWWDCDTKPGPESVTGAGVRSVLCVPMHVGNRFLGAIYLDSLTGHRVFDDSTVAFVEAVAEVATLALEYARAHTRWIEAVRLSAEFAGVKDVDAVLDHTLGRVVQMTRAEQGFIVLHSEETDDLRYARGVDRQGTSVKGGEEFLSWTVVHRVAASGEAEVHDDIKESAGDVSSVIGLTSVMCVPIKARHSVKGVLYLENRDRPGVFGDEDRRLVQFVADRAGVAIESARLHAQSNDVMNALANAIEARDATMSSHIQRVTRYAQATGRAMGLGQEDLSVLAQATALHDVGKIGVPDAILLKANQLDTEEWRRMRLHPETGVKIVEPLRLPPEVAEAILTHHENFDGSGYPRGIAGAAIPLFGRIVAVVDAFDAMTSDRPFQPGRSVEEALEELRNCSGAKYDPAVVAAFLGCVEADPGLVADVTAD